MTKQTTVNGEINKDWTKIELDAYDGPEPYIFISYSHKDTKQVYEILKIIDREKYRYWYDDTMEIGEDFREELRSRIENCSAFLLFLSNEALLSKYCGMEIITAHKYDKRIYPVYLSDDVVIPAPLKMILENLQHVSGISKQNTDKYISKLIQSLPIETMRNLQTENDVLTHCKDGSTSIAVPSGIRVIGEGAFKNCDKLEDIDFGTEVEVLNKEAFRGCKSLKEIRLAQNIRKVGESAFRDCINAKSLSVECGKIELGERAFENCASLSEIELCDDITEIYGGVFNSCKSLRSIDLPKKLTIIGESAFADCAKLRSVKIPSHVTKLDDMVFSGCVELESVDLNSTLSIIGKNCFKECISLKTIQIPASVKSIGLGLFRGCVSLENILVDPKNKWYKTVDDVLFNKNKSTIICYPSQRTGDVYVIPDSVTVISDWTFCNSKLKSIEIPDSVNNIGEGAFYNNTNIEHMVLPDSVTRIDDSAFRGCVSLKTVVIPSSVSEFGWGLFSGCDKVTIICEGRSAAAKYCATNNIAYKEK
ncbi:MAG: leucine-rich repeat protein [Clostridia bacterium]|jgi:hypothetical protein|nr:leucine-rich repeat protein [Clostridia bacterium]